MAIQEASFNDFCFSNQSANAMRLSRLVELADVRGLASTRRTNAKSWIYLELVWLHKLLKVDRFRLWPGILHPLRLLTEDMLQLLECDCAFEVLGSNFRCQAWDVHFSVFELQKLLEAHPFVLAALTKEELGPEYVVELGFEHTLPWVCMLYDFSQFALGLSLQFAFLRTQFLVFLLQALHHFLVSFYLVVDFGVAQLSFLGESGDGLLRFEIYFVDLVQDFARDKVTRLAARWYNVGNLLLSFWVAVLGLLNHG